MLPRNLLQRSFLVLCALLCLWLNGRAFASARGDLEAKLKAQYVGRAVFVRRAYVGKELNFNADGSPSQDYKSGSWAVAAGFSIENLRVRDGVVELHGKRILLKYDSKQRQFHTVAPVPSVAGFPLQLDTNVSREEKGRWSDLKPLQNLTIRVRFSPATDEAEIHAALDKVFLASEEKLSEVVPVHWREVVCLQEQLSNGKEACDRTAKEAAVIGPVFKVGEGVTAPRPLSTSDPEYDEVAKRAHEEGTCVLKALIGATGSPLQLRIEQPIGLGLDEQALRAVSMWRFQPAIKEGNPVQVWITITVSFRLY
jgi:TonB family protein